MPIVISGGRVPPVMTQGKGLRPARAIDGQETKAHCIRVALINNMPDSALEDTELQFFELLDASAGDIPVCIKLYSLPELPRSPCAQQHLRNFYFGMDDLLNSYFDGVIITGTEPRQPNLRDEPYWRTLTDILDWAEHNTASTVLSCLAAHAGVLYKDGIDRHKLSDKQFGVFDYTKVADHALTMGTADLIRIPHSRWNEVREDALTSCGYVVVTKSAETGVDMFVKKKKRSLFVHFQGHPEYGPHTLLKEYKRDIRRFLERERETYPSLPHGYFDAAATKLVADFRKSALADPRAELLAGFPEAAVVNTLQNAWRSSAALVYRNWLQYIVSKKDETLVHAATAPNVRGRLRQSSR